MNLRFLLDILRGLFILKKTCVDVRGDSGKREFCSCSFCVLLVLPSANCDDLAVKLAYTVESFPQLSFVTEVLRREIGLQLEFLSTDELKGRDDFGLVTESFYVADLNLANILLYFDCTWPDFSRSCHWNFLLAEWTRHLGQHALVVSFDHLFETSDFFV